MLGPSPYALATPAFRFQALAATVGRAAMGGPREAALVALLAARMAAGAAPAGGLSPAQRARRAEAARGWVGTMALSPVLRAAIGRLLEASAGSDPSAVAGALCKVTDVTAQWLDRPARSELEALAAKLVA
ncbi:MAG: hypothetical protein U9Q74_10490, partial [Gemmatimonadota bacterium]|nr:hypothetical protein [Gemmatimonadota bacterium]